VALRVRKVVIWRGRVENRPGALARVFANLAGAGLEVVMGYVEHGGKSEAIVEVFPIVGRKLRAAAQRAGFRPSATPTLLVTSDGGQSLGPLIARRLGAAGIGMAFLVALTGGRQWSALLGFLSATDARSAARLIRKAQKENDR
jgi:hypothetical protein